MEIKNKGFSAVIIIAVILLVLSGCVTAPPKKVESSSPNITQTEAENIFCGEFCTIQGVQDNKESPLGGCCFPTECPEAINNPEDCDCIYAVMCYVEDEEGVEREVVENYIPPIVAFCTERGYTYSLDLDINTYMISGSCNFPNNESCNLQDFYAGECGVKYATDIDCKKKYDRIYPSFEECCDGLKVYTPDYVLAQSTCITDRPDEEEEWYDGDWETYEEYEEAFKEYEEEISWEEDEAVPDNYEPVLIYETECKYSGLIYCNYSYPPQCTEPDYCYNKSRTIWMPKHTISGSVGGSGGSGGGSPSSVSKFDLIRGVEVDIDCIDTQYAPKTYEWCRCDGKSHNTCQSYPSIDKTNCIDDSEYARDSYEWCRCQDKPHIFCQNYFWGCDEKGCRWKHK